jgi:hypothetical protein
MQAAQQCLFFGFRQKSRLRSGQHRVQADCALASDLAAQTSILRESVPKWRIVAVQMALMPAASMR